MTTTRCVFVLFIVLFSCSLVLATNVDENKETKVDLPYRVGTVNLQLSDPRQPGKTIYSILHYPITNGTAGNFPLLVFAPGWNFRDTFYDYLWRTLVPSGYVMAIDGSYGYDAVSDPLWKARDQAFVLEYLRDQSTNNKQSPVYGLIGTVSAAMGHSEGGVTSLIAADPNLLDHKYKYNFTTVVDLSGCFGGFGDDYIAAKHDNVPILFITGDHDCICPAANSYYLWTVSPSTCKIFTNIMNGSHCRFADPGPVNGFFCFDLETLLGCGFEAKLPPQVQFDRVLTYTMPWLDWVLKGKAAGKTQLYDALQSDKSKGKVQYSISC